jgi:uncharacterized protein (TIRG00374 family)
MSIEPSVPEKQKRRSYKWVVRLIGIALFAYILIFRIDLSGLSAVLSKLKTLPLALSVILVFPFILIKASRWTLFLKDFNISLSGKGTFSLYAIGLFAGHATPGQLGEFSKAIFMKKLGYPYDSSIVTILFDRIFDLFILLLLALVGAVAFRGLLVGQISIFIFSFVGISLLLLLVASAQVRAYLMGTIGASLLPKKLKEGLRNSSFWQKMKQVTLKRNTMLKALALSIFAFAFAFFRYYLLILSLNISISFWFFIGSVAIASVVSFIPVSFAGIGTRDATLIYLFAYLGIKQEQAVSFSLLILLLLLVNMIIGFICWLRFTGKEMETKP